MTVEKTGKVQPTHVDVPRKTDKKEEPRTVQIDMTGGNRPVAQNPLDIMEQITGKKAFDTPAMKAFQEYIAKATDEEKTKLAKMNPQERDAYVKEQENVVRNGITERAERRENEQTTLGRYVQGWKDDFKGVKDAKGAAATAGAVADAVVGRTRSGFASVDKAVGLPQGVTEKVWAGAATVATGSYLLEAMGGTAGVMNTASTLLANPGSRAVGAFATAASPMLLGSCDKFDEEHNYEINLPTDTIEKIKYITLPAETLTVVKHDTLIEYRDSIVEVPVYIPGKDSIVYKTDTLKIEVPVIKHDTIKIEVPGPVVTVPEEWKSPIPDKQKEIFDKLGINVDKSGKFVLSMNYFNEYPSTLDLKNIDGRKSARDGSMIVYNGIQTGWGDDGKLTLGKNETYAKYQYTLSNDGKNLSIRTLVPKANPSVSNNDKKPNWTVFENQLKDDVQWTDKGVVNFEVGADGKVHMSGSEEAANGLLEKGDIENSVMYTNPYEAKWRLSDCNVKTGNAY